MARDRLPLVVLATDFLAVDCLRTLGLEMGEKVGGGDGRSDAVAEGGGGVAVEEWLLGIG